MSTLSYIGAQWLEHAEKFPHILHTQVYSVPYALSSDTCSHVAVACSLATLFSCWIVLRLWGRNKKCTMWAKFLDTWPSHPHMVLVQTVAAMLEVCNCLQYHCMLYYNFPSVELRGPNLFQHENAVPLCTKQAPWRHGMSWTWSERTWVEELLNPPHPTAVPELTNVLEAKWASPHSHALKSSRKPGESLFLKEEFLNRKQIAHSVVDRQVSYFWNNSLPAVHIHSGSIKNGRIYLHISS